MTAPVRAARPPLPTIIAIVLFSLAAVRLAWFTAVLAWDLEWVAVFPAAFLFLWAVVIRGLWRGGRGALVIAVVLAALNLMSALAAGAGFVLPEQRDPHNPLTLQDGVLSVTGVAVTLAILLLLLKSKRSRAYFARP